MPGSSGATISKTPTGKATGPAQSNTTSRVMADVQDIQFKDAASRAAEAAERLAQTSGPDGELPELHGEKMVLNMGPSHPATHGVLRIILELDGEFITRATPDIGY